MSLTGRFEFYTDMVNRIWEQHSEIQTMMLRAFQEEVRQCDVELLIKYKAFIVPTNVYLLNIIGSDVMAPSYGLYLGSECRFNRRLCIPIRGFDGRVHGFVGYDDGSECKTPEEKLNNIPYLYLDKSSFIKSKYMFITPDEYKQALQEKYICIVDGIFDKISCQSLGIPATSLLSSRLTKHHRKYLSYVPNWIVLADNDNAGNLLTSACKRANANTIRLRFNGAKDIDEFLKKDKTNIRKLLTSITEVKTMGYHVDWRIS